MSFKKIFLVGLFILLIATSVAQTSPKIAFIKSLLIPGWGELSNGSKTGYFLLSSEIALLSTQFFYSNEVTILNEEAYQYAIKFAGINSGEYNDRYWTNLTRYASSGFEAGGYNSYIYQEALSIYPNDTDAQQEYIDNNRIADSQSWDWNSKTNRAHFSHIKVRQRSAEDISKTLVGVVTLNHIVSAINATRISLKQKKIGLNVSVNRHFKPNISYTIKF